MSYRTRIYEQYAHSFQIRGYKRADLYLRWADAYGYFLRRWLPKEKGVKIADVGCGGGQLMAAMRHLGYHGLIGVDLSPQQVELARQRGFSVEEDDVIRFLERNESGFDLIMAMDIAEHLGKDELLDFLERGFKALRIGGRIVLQMPNPNSLFGMSVRYGDLTHEVCLGPDCAVRLLKMVGFKNCEVREAGPIPHWKSPLGVARWVAWRLLCVIFTLYNSIETGSMGTCIFTRVYFISAVRVD